MLGFTAKIVFRFQETSTGNTTTCCGCSNTEVSRPRVTTCFWEITSTEENSRWKLSVCCLPTRSNIQRISSCSEEITNVPASTESTAFTMNVSVLKRKGEGRTRMSLPTNVEKRQPPPIRTLPQVELRMQDLSFPYSVGPDSRKSTSVWGRSPTWVGLRGEMRFSPVLLTLHFLEHSAKKLFSANVHSRLGQTWRKAAKCKCLFLTTGKRRYNIKLWKTFTDCFNCLPIAAIIDEKIFCCHGGETIVWYFVLGETPTYLVSGQLWGGNKLPTNPFCINVHQQGSLLWPVSGNAVNHAQKFGGHWRVCNWLVRICQWLFRVMGAEIFSVAISPPIFSGITRRRMRSWRRACVQSCASLLSCIVFCRVESRPPVHGTNQANYATNGRARPRIAVWPVVVGPRQGNDGLGRERQGRVVHLWLGSGRKVPTQTRPGLDMQGSSGVFRVWAVNLARPYSIFRKQNLRKGLSDKLLLRFPGCGRRVWILREAAISHIVLGTELLRRVRQRWCYDECGRDADVFVPGACCSYSMLCCLFAFRSRCFQWRASLLGNCEAEKGVLEWCFSAKIRVQFHGYTQ